MATDSVLDGVLQGRPLVGPSTVHIDVTNGCNARCITCWDHSPLLSTPRSAAWKRGRLNVDVFHRLVDDLVSMNSVRSLILSGMGEPLTHPDIYTMIDRVKSEGLHLTVLSNLVGADIERLANSGVDQVLVGVHGVTPDVYAAFHPGWDTSHFFTLCKHLRRLGRHHVAVRHVQVINRDTAPQVPEMVHFAKLFGAERLNYKLASLAEGTEACTITEEQVRWLHEVGIDQAQDLATDLGVSTNISLFREQVRAALGDARATVPIQEVGCYMGYVYSRVTVDQEVLFCCNTEVSVGSLGDASFSELWWGERWQDLREQLARGEYFPGCARCGKFEQNQKWSRKVESARQQVAK